MFLSLIFSQGSNITSHIPHSYHSPSLRKFKIILVQTSCVNQLYYGENYSYFNLKLYTMIVIIKLFGYLFILILTRVVPVLGEFVSFLYSQCPCFWNVVFLRKICESVLK